MKVGIYARTSRNDCGDELGKQIGDMKKWAEEVGWRIYRTYTDRAPATDMAHRPAWRQMLRDASDGCFNVLLLSGVDRGLRSENDAKVTEEELRKRGVMVCSYSDPESRLMLHVLAWVRSEYSARMRRFRRTMSMGRGQ